MHDETSDIQEPERRGPSRRTVLKAAAWSVPVIVVANAAPVAAQAVTSVPIRIDFPGSGACKIPGNSYNNPPGLCYNKGYVLWAKIDNIGQESLRLLSIESMIVGGIQQCIVNTNFFKNAGCPGGALKFRPNPADAYVGSAYIDIPSGGSAYVAVFSNASSDSQNTSLVVNFTWTTTSNPGTPQPGQSSGSLSGDPWTGPYDPSTGDSPGACKFPTGNTCINPPSASGTVCATC